MVAADFRETYNKYGRLPFRQMGEAPLRQFNEDTRVKIPATFQLIRIGYQYQSMNDSDIDFDTKIFVNRFKPAIEKINSREFSSSEIKSLITEIHTLIRSNDLGRAFYTRLTDTANDIKLIDFDNPENNDFAVVDELSYTIEKDTDKGSFRPDINILVNGMPLAFLEVKKPNNEGGIQKEFNRMINQRLENPAYKKFFNLIQIVSFSNNMEYEDADDMVPEMIRAGSFYTTPNANKTSFSFFREDDKDYIKDYPYMALDDTFARDIIKDLGYKPEVYDTESFQAALELDTPCNRFVTSLFDKERFLFLIRYGMMYLSGKVPQKHIMRYPQFFAVRRIIDRLEKGQMRGIIWHTQGSGKTELAAYANKVIRDYYAKKNTVTRFFFVVDRIDLLRQDNGEFSSRHFAVTTCNSKTGFSTELQTVLPNSGTADKVGEFVVVNIQKFESAIPKARNEYDSNIQRVFFIDEAHRSYRAHGEYFKNLILCDPNAVFIALTGTPLLSKRERSNLKFGDYIHKYFYDKSIADGYTLRIKREKIDTTERNKIKQNVHFEERSLDSADVYESDQYINDLGTYIDKDFRNFRLVNTDNTIGGMIVCRSSTQAKKMHAWFKENSQLSTGLVISDPEDTNQSAANKNNQLDFKYEGHPDILVVEYMLTTGYDVDRLKKMYLLRGPHAQNLLQTISRVNRPYKSPQGIVYKFGYITDFVDIDKEYDRTINDYLKELEEDINDTEDDDGEGHNSLSGLLADIETIKKRFLKAQEDLDDIITAPNLEKFSKRLTNLNRETLQVVKRLLNTMKDCYIEMLLSNDMESAEKVDINQIKDRLKATQERIDFINLREKPVSMIDMISDKEIVEIVYEFVVTSITVIDMSNYVIGDTSEYKDFTDTLHGVQVEIKKNRNKNDIRVVHLNEALKQLFEKMNIKDISDLPPITEEMKEILKEAQDINRENERLAEIYDGNFALVRTYQDSMIKHQDMSNKDIEAAIKIIYGQIKDIIGIDTLEVQGRQGFIDETKKKVTKELLKSGLYKELNLKNWIDSLLSELYTNLQSYK